MGLYTRLDASHREIRLLQILPASSPPGADHLPPPLHCELSVHRLQGINNTTRYTALSYTWGPEPSTVGGGSPANTLTVNGEVLRAPENLLLCLDAFRRRRQQGGGGGSGDGCAEYIWADAVCINQNDLQEKETQIPLMKDIYELAVQTVIWLGPAEGDSDLAMDTLECLDPKDFQAARFSAEQGRRWQAIMELLRRPWCKLLLIFVFIFLLFAWISSRWTHCFFFRDENVGRARSSPVPQPNRMVRRQAGSL